MEDENSNLKTLDAMQSAQQAFGGSASQMTPTMPTQPEPRNGVQSGIVGRGDSVFKMGQEAPQAPTQSKFSMFGNAQSATKQKANPLDGLTGVLKNQYDTLFKTAMDAASARVNGVTKPPVEMPPPIDVQTLSPQKTEVKNANGETVPTVGGEVAQQNGVTMGRGMFGGGETPTYARNGVSIQLPEGIDLNDDAAVGRSIAELNAHMDFMDSLNDDNGWD